MENKIKEDIKEPKKAKRDILNYVHDELFRLNFYRVHLSYFIIVIAISSVIVYGEGLANARGELDGNNLRYIDALFLCTSAMTTTGLNTVNVGDLTGFQQAVLCILLLLGNVVFVSMSICVIRVYYFRKKLKHLVEHSKAGRQALEDVESDGALGGDGSGHASSVIQQPENGLSSPQVRKRGNKSKRRVNSQKQHTEDAERLSLLRQHHHHQTGFGNFPAPWESRNVQKAFHYPFRNFASQPHEKQHSYLSFEPDLDERGRIVHPLNEMERDELGGIEYRAQKLLIYVLVAYQFLWIALGVVFLVPYSYRSSVSSIIRTSQPGNLKPGWWAFFAAVTSFSNGGLNLLNSNFEPFTTYYLILIVTGALTIAGQTHFPVFLRLICWTMTKILPTDSRTRQTFLFLLHHPRRCFIYMFPAKETWYLFAIQLVIDLTAWVLFEILNLGNTLVTSTLPQPGPYAFNGLFQAVGLRTSGAYIITLSNLAPALLVAYVVAMYISSFPIVMALRRTNTYEEQSIGLDKEDTQGGGGGGGGLVQHLRMQLAYDIWFQILAWFLIAAIQRTQLMTPQPGFGLFNLLFEVTSAYGTVGLSTGVPGQDYSLSGQFKTLSKVVMLFVMVRGRHRGLPFAIDRSILLPGEKLMHRMDGEYARKGRVREGEEEEIREDEEESGGNQEGGEGVSSQDPEGGKGKIEGKEERREEREKKGRQQGDGRSDDGEEEEV